ncbi:MAG TPA: glycoside hydrolase family 2 TIM barrel-domain containing protein, partial [Prolixibacteraceae bacterium]|nr:glycoside hydrolase family 2 TIM barrel-domain containing protein [Prolixibacteraceae bacterium]
MKTFLNFLVLIFTVVFCTASPKGKLPENSRTVSFDADWLFLKGNPSGAENPAFDDSGWRKLDLPHDWSIEDLPEQIPDSIVGPFSKASVGKMSTGYTIGGTAWYRKHFTLNRNDEGKVAYLRFDGVYMNSDVWINGKHVGFHPYGYTSFYYDITPFLKAAGQINCVAVQVKNEGRNARWYSGSGIYRHTWLTLVNPVHIGEWGVFVTTPVVNEAAAEVKVATTLLNSGKENVPVTVRTEIIDPQGNVKANIQEETSVSGSSNSVFEQKVTIDRPALWSVDQPELYRARVTVSTGKKVKDQTVTTFGIRKITIDARNGMLLNGKPLELKGGCFHHDNGPLGAAIIDRAEERKIEILKKAGYNAIRCSHNPPSPELLDVCDRLGILVMDEIFDNWEKEKVSPEDYSKDFKEWWQSDLRSMIMRDRNHPSVFLWSVGNEIREAMDTAGLRIITNLVKEVKRLDPTRGVTEALMDFSGRRGEASRWDAAAPHMALLDVMGYNYLYSRYEADHEKHPDRVMVATEFMPLYALENWQMVEKHPYVIGNFAWVCMDYLGEAGVGLSRLVPDVPA